MDGDSGRPVAMRELIDSFTPDAIVMMGAAVYDIRCAIEQAARKRHRSDGPVNSSAVRRAIWDLELSRLVQLESLLRGDL